MDDVYLYPTGETVLSDDHIRCTLAIPANAAPGYYWVRVGNLPGPYVYTGLSNSFQVAHASDLFPLTFGAPRGPVGRTFTIYNAVKNYGSTAAGPFYAGFYLSPDTTITTDDILVGYRNYESGLDARTSGANENTQVTIPSSVAAGTYYLGTITDFTHSVAEGDEGNNVFCDHYGVTFTPLTVTAITPDGGWQGSTVAIANLAGAGFVSGATVRLARNGYPDIAAIGVTVVSPTQIDATSRWPARARRARGTWS